MKYLLPLLFAASLSATEVRLEWKDNSDNELGFIVERKDAKGEYGQVGETDEDVDWYAEDVPRGTYHYRVCAWNDEGDSGYTNEYLVKISGPPKDPTKMKVTITLKSK